MHVTNYSRGAHGAKSAVTRASRRPVRFIGLGGDDQKMQYKGTLLSNIGHGPYLVWGPHATYMFVINPTSVL